MINSPFISTQKNINNIERLRGGTMSNSVSKSGQVGGKTSAFNQTCDRLREYLKEKRASENTTTLTTSSTTTMNLFPLKNQNDAVRVAEDDCDRHVLSDMTIFYNGRVIVIENVPRPKADQIIRIATDLSLSGFGNSDATAPAAAITNNSVACDLSYLTHPIARDLSQTRSRSLTRFFEKRKERINAGAPYTLRDKSWLGLSTATGN